MRLAEFILHSTEPILAEWEAFAATLLPATAGMTSLALRDHAQNILEAVAKDLATSQTREAQSDNPSLRKHNYLVDNRLSGGERLHLAKWLGLVIGAFARTCRTGAVPNRRMDSARARRS
jgi:hypothetical protein